MQDLDHQPQVSTSLKFEVVLGLELGIPVVLSP